MSEDTKIIEKAKARLKECIDAEADERRKALDDLEFLAATPDNPTQWSDAALRDRARTGRPALVVNRLDQFVLHISNAMRQNRVSSRVFPVDDKADVDTAEIYQGIIRHIERNSKGTLAYDTAAFYAVACGFGFWTHTTEYCDPRSFEQDIRLVREPNPFQIYLGAHSLPDGSDAEYGFKFTDMTKAEYEAEYPKFKVASADWADSGDYADTWIKQDGIRIVEFWVKEWTSDTLIRKPDGTTALLSEMPEDFKLESVADEDQRETRTCIVKWYKLNAYEILDETEWPIPNIPIVKVTGHELTVSGKRVLKGIVRNLKDAQRMYNFMLSAETEAIDSSKGQIVAYDGQLEGHEEEWKRPSENKVLTVKEMTVGGQPAPIPGRLQPNMSIPAMTQARLMAAEDLKALTGVYDDALGRTTNEKSGKAILARQTQTDTANFHFQDNLTLSISYSTQMLVALIPKIYDTPRVVRIIGEDETQKVVKVNQQIMEGNEPKTYSLTTGKYDVVCTAGPSFQSKRQEGAALLTQMAGNAPILMNAAPDLIMRSLDVPYADEIADRLKKTLPPNLQDPEDGKPEIPPQVQRQLEQQSAVLKAMTDELNAKNQLIENKQMELESKERIEMAKIQAQQANAQAEIEVRRMEIQARMMQENAKLDTQEQIALLQAEIEGMKLNIQVNSQQLAEETAGAARES